MAAPRGRSTVGPVLAKAPRKLEAIGLAKDFHRRRPGGTTPVLEHIDLGADAGEFLAILGPSGCGKTTLLRIVAGLLRPTRGGVRVDGRAIHDPGRDRAMVFQDAALLPWRTVLGNVAYGLECLGVGRRQATAMGRPWVTLVGLEGFERFYPYGISGGMQQRVNLARALAVDPEILLMDEPFASLDAQTREALQSELLTIWGRSAKTVAFVTHDIGEALYLADRVIVLSGRPARVRETVDVTLPRPRDQSVRRLAWFRECEDHVRQLLRQPAPG